ncbi:MAG: TetR/AcrR family transcriptional regulator [Mycolicibacterium sp.]
MDQPSGPTVTMSRRERRRQETIDEILDLSLEVMKQEGVAGLNLTAVAKRLGVQPTALYKYFPSLIAVYDALFRRALETLFEQINTAVSAAQPGMATIRAAVQTASAFAADNPELAQLIIWRPVPGYKPAPEAMGPSSRIVDIFTQALDDAAAAGEIAPEISGRRGAHIVSVLLTGAVSLHMADSGDQWEPDDFIEMVPDLVDMFVTAFSPAGSPNPADGSRDPRPADDGD